MLYSQQIAVFSILTASVIYVWSRYQRKRKEFSDRLNKSLKATKVISLNWELSNSIGTLFTPLEVQAQTSLCNESILQSHVSSTTSPRIHEEQVPQPSPPNCLEELIIPSQTTMSSSMAEIAVSGLASLSISDKSLEQSVQVGCIASDSELSEDLNTPVSSNEDFSEQLKVYDIPPGVFDDPDNDITEDSPEVMGGRKIPRVLVPSDLWAEVVETGIWRETFYVPASMGGVLIGRFGKNVRELKSLWNAEFSLNMCPGRQDTLLLRLSCPLEFKENVTQWIANRFKMRPSQTTIGNPNQLRRLLPLGEVTRVQIRCLYGLKEFFVTIKDQEYERYITMQGELDKDYATLNSSRMQLYEPVTSGTVAVLPHNSGFARSLIIKVLPTWPRNAACFLLDHGTFAVVGLSELRKIKAKYMKVPFQAIHVSWAHALPIYCDVPDLHILRTFFSSNRICAFAVRMETCCRASVAFLDSVSNTNKIGSYTDTLALACRSGLYMVSPLGLFPSRQVWLNRTNLPYYACPYSEIDYTQLVEYFSDDQYATKEMQQLGSAQSPPINEAKHFRNARGSYVSGRSRGTRRFNGSTRFFPNQTRRRPASMSSSKQNQQDSFDSSAQPNVKNVTTSKANQNGTLGSKRRNTAPKRYNRPVSPKNKPETPTCTASREENGTKSLH